MSGEGNPGAAPPRDSQLKAYWQVLEREPSSRVFAPLALYLVRSGKIAEAEQVCRRGLRYNPDFSDGHLALARVLVAKRRLQEARAELDKAIELNPHSVDALLARARVRASSGDIEGAVEDCMKALDVSPRNAPARQLLSRLGRAKRRAAAEPKGGGFRDVAPTAPSRRARHAENPQRSLGEVSDEAIQRIDASRQPFQQESEGSGLQSGRGQAGTGPQPVDLLDQVGVQPEGDVERRSELPPRPDPAAVPSKAAREMASVVASSQLPLVHVVQSVIDRVGDEDFPGTNGRMRLSRSGGFKALAGFVLLLLAVVAVVWLAVGRSSDVARSGAVQGKESTRPVVGQDAGSTGR